MDVERAINDRGIARRPIASKILPHKILPKAFPAAKNEIPVEALAQSKLNDFPIGFRFPIISSPENVPENIPIKRAQKTGSKNTFTDESLYCLDISGFFAGTLRNNADVNIIEPYIKAKSRKIN